MHVGRPAPRALQGPVAATVKDPMRTTPAILAPILGLLAAAAVHAQQTPDRTGACLGDEDRRVRCPIGAASHAGGGADPTPLTVPFVVTFGTRKRQRQGGSARWVEKEDVLAMRWAWVD
jgi:hypothetical protein